MTRLNQPQTDLKSSVDAQEQGSDDGYLSITSSWEEYQANLLKYFAGVSQSEGNEAEQKSQDSASSSQESNGQSEDKASQGGVSLSRSRYRGIQAAATATSASSSEPGDTAREIPAP